MILMGVYTGRRSEEIRGLRWGDIQHTADGCVRYHWKGKGGKSQWADLPSPVYKAIRLYLEAAGRKPGMDEPVFVAHNGSGQRTLSGEWFNQMVKGYAQAAGLPEWVHAHSLRHTAAALRLQGGRGVVEIQRLLGHSSLRVTQIYLEALEGFRDEGWPDVERLIEAGQDR
jgi:integrase